MGLLIGCLAFGLFFLGDWNDWKRHLPLLRGCFPAGAAALSAATVTLADWPGDYGAGNWIALAGAAGFLALLIYTLFFALPASDAYVRQGEQRMACTTGVYALCRHPGVLWFAGLYACLWPAAGVPLTAGALFTALNVLLVVFEDGAVFPAQLKNYGAYRRSTPFLIPGGASVRRAFARTEKDI